MIIQSRHSERHSDPTIAGKLRSKGSGNILGNMFERIAGPTLNSVQGKHPMNYATLELPLHLVRTYSDRSARQCEAFAKWVVHPFSTANVAFHHALLKIEHANQQPNVIKIQLNFSDASHLTLERAQVGLPDSLRCAESYDPQAVFRKQTQTVSAAFNSSFARKLRTLVDERGHPTYPHSARPSTFNRDRLFRTAPEPVTGRAGYQFTPVSYLSFEMRPNSRIPGCRPGITETNKRYVGFRPRPLSPKPTSPITQEDRVARLEHINQAKPADSAAVAADAAVNVSTS